MVQEIRLKQEAMPQPKAPPVLQPPYDSRLMTKPPSRRTNSQEIVDLLEPFIKRGLHLKFDDNGERWFMVFGKKTDEGSIRMPLRTVWSCAEKIIR